MNALLTGSVSLTDLEHDRHLFEGGPVRRFVHRARFQWAGRHLRGMSRAPKSVLDLGCSNARALFFLPSATTEYYGLDTDHDGGLSEARALYRDNTAIRLIKSCNPSDLDSFPELSVDAGLCLETFEHLDPNDTNPYLAHLSRIISGPTLFTVPNEVGAVFMVKHIAKVLHPRLTPDDYSLQEIFWQLTGEVQRVRRLGHKGFSWRVAVLEIAKFFDIRRVEAVQFFPGWPLALSPTIGVVATPSTFKNSVS